MVKIDATITVTINAPDTRIDSVLDAINQLKAKIQKLGDDTMSAADEIKAVLDAIDTTSNALAADVAEVKRDQQALIDRLANAGAGGIPASGVATLLAQAKAIKEKLDPIATELNDLGKTDPTESTGDAPPV